MSLSPDYFLLTVVLSGLAIIFVGGVIYMVRCSFCCCCSCCPKMKKRVYGEGGRRGSVKQGHGFYTSPTFAISSPDIDHMVFHQISQTQLYGDFLGSNGLHGPEGSANTGLLTPQVYAGGACTWMNSTHDGGPCGTDASTDAANDDMIMFM